MQLYEKEVFLVLVAGNGRVLDEQKATIYLPYAIHKALPFRVFLPPMRGGAKQLDGTLTEEEALRLVKETYPHLFS